MLVRSVYIYCFHYCLPSLIAFTRLYCCICAQYFMILVCMHCLHYCLHYLLSLSRHSLCVFVCVVVCIMYCHSLFARLCAFWVCTPYSTLLFALFTGALCRHACDRLCVHCTFAHLLLPIYCIIYLSLFCNYLCAFIYNTYILARALFVGCFLSCSLRTLPSGSTVGGIYC